MLNSASIVGRLTSDPKSHEFEDGNKTMVFVLAVTRSFKNKATGKYDADYILCKMWGNKTNTLVNHCKKGDIVGFTGKLSSRKLEQDDGKNRNEQYFTVDKITLFPKAMNEIPYEIKKAPKKGEKISTEQSEQELEAKQKDIKDVKDDLPF